MIYTRPTLRIGLWCCQSPILKEECTYSWVLLRVYFSYQCNFATSKRIQTVVLISSQTVDVECPYLAVNDDGQVFTEWQSRLGSAEETLNLITKSFTLPLRFQFCNINLKHDFAKFLNSAAERSFIKLDEFLRKGKTYPSFELHYPRFCLSLQGSSKILQSRVKGCLFENVLAPCQLIPIDAIREFGRQSYNFVTDVVVYIKSILATRRMPNKGILWMGFCYHPP